MVGFLFGGNTGESYTSLQRRRAMADALAAQVMGFQPKNTAEGIGAVLKGIGAGIGRYRADKAQEAGASAADSLFNSIIGGSSAGGVGQAASIGMPGAAAELANSRPGAVAAADVSKNGSTFTPFIDTVKAGGLENPFGLAAVAATGRAESGWDAKKAAGSWADPSESGQSGTSGGVMSWRAERLGNLRAYAARKGEQGNGSPQTQAEFFLAEDPNLIARLNSAKSVEEAQGMMNNAWKFAGYNRAGGEAGRRQGYANGYVSQFQGGGGQQVASLDPSIGMNTPAGAIDAIAPPSGSVAPQQQAAPAFDPNRWGDPIKLSEMPAGTGDLGQRLDAQANAFVPPQQSPQAPAGALPPLDQRQVAPTPSVASQPPQMPHQQAPMHVAQAAPQIDQRLLQALSNPFLDDEKKSVIRMMLQQQMEAADPMRQMQLEKGRLELDALRNPQAKYDYQTLPDGTVLRTSNRGGVPEKVYESAPKPTTNQLDYEYYADREVKQGRQPLGPLEWEQAQRKAGATTVNNNMGEGDKFYEKLDQKNAEMFATLSDAGMSARGKMGQINRLEGLFANVPQGIEGGLKKIAGDWGVAIGEGTSDIQAASSLLERMVPEQRAPGSGPMSDADIKMFRASLPRIINQPGGNQLIFGTLRGIAEYETKMGEIADAVADRTITAAEGRKQIRELRNPLEDYKIPEGSTPNQGWKDAAPGVKFRRLGD